MKNKIFITLLVLYSLLYLSKLFQINLGLISAYLADLIAIPFIILLLERFMKVLYTDRFKTNIFHIAITVIAVSVMFEVVLPKYNSHFYADPFDVLCYFSGGIITFFILQFQVSKT